jgi:peptidoglycan/xylan/chitin deacetylase (PgdA/CDA1 family)
VSFAGRSIRWLRAEALERLGVNAAARARLDGSRAVILAYHRVLPSEEAERLHVEPSMMVTPATFRSHLDWLEASFLVLSLDELASRLSDGRSLPAGACAITFDDGWRDNYEHALPELARRRLPATVFVVTSRVGSLGAFWPDRVGRRLAAAVPAERERLAALFGAPGSRDPVSASIAALKQCSEAERRELLDRVFGDEPEHRSEERELLDWDEVGQMASAGVAIEAHGATHALLTGLPDDAAARELRDCRQALQERGYGSGALLAYPSGRNNARSREFACEAGFRAAVTLKPGLATRSSDPLALPRVTLHQDVSRTRSGFHRIVPGRSADR